jgi:riboflavin biosynthesis pyrimidine reductase
VFVQSRDGNTVTSNPSEFGGGDTDKHLVYEGLSRVAADAVLAGSGSVAREQLFSVWHPELVKLRTSLGMPRHPVQIVASRRGVPLDGLLLFNVPDVRAVLVTVAETATRLRDALIARPWVSTVVLNAPDDLPDAFRTLASMGVARISCIGGRTLAERLLQAELVDDVYLTTGVRAGGEPGTPLSRGRWRGRVVVRKHGTGAEGGVVFEHVLPAMQGRIAGHDRPR